MSEEKLAEMGPIDYMVLEWAGDQPVTGEVMALLLDLVDRDIIRILDIAFLVKGEDGSVAAIDLAELAQKAGGLAPFESASSGLLGQDVSDKLDVLGNLVLPVAVDPIDSEAADGRAAARGAKR